MHISEIIQQILDNLQSTFFGHKKNAGTKTDIVTDVRKSDTNQRTTPKRGNEIARPYPSPIPGIGNSFSLATKEKVGTQEISRTKPNNSETRALMDRLTRTIDPK